MEYVLDDTAAKRSNSCRPAIVVQARMGSTRLPGKVMLPLAQSSMLAFLLKRLFRVGVPVVVATSTQAVDDQVAELASDLGACVVRGSEEDVLSRFCLAAQGFDAIVRICSDCPLSDPNMIDKALDLFYAHSLDYLSNTLHRTYPRGFDVEVVSVSSLEYSLEHARKPSEREHVTPYIIAHPEKFSQACFVSQEPMDHWRLTVDTQEDLSLIRKIVASSERLDYNSIVSLLRSHDSWREINAHIQQKEVQ